MTWNPSTSQLVLTFTSITKDVILSLPRSINRPLTVFYLLNPVFDDNAGLKHCMSGACFWNRLQRYDFCCCWNLCMTAFICFDVPAKLCPHKWYDMASFPPCTISYSSAFSTECDLFSLSQFIWGHAFNKITAWRNNGNLTSTIWIKPSEMTQLQRLVVCSED